MELLRVLFTQAKALYPQLSSQLLFNEEPHNTPQNILINFSSEQYHIRSSCIPAKLFDLRELEPDQWPLLRAGNGANKHLFIVSRIGQRLHQQYTLSKENTQWLEAHHGVPLVFLRRRINEPTENLEEVQLFWIADTTVWEQFLSVVEGTPIVSSISLHAWAFPDWADDWVNTLVNHTQSTILFDLPPHKQLEAIFAESCHRVDINKAWLRHEDYHHCVLAMQGHLKAVDDKTPLFLLPAGETTCNVVSNYALQELPSGLFKEDADFLTSQSWLMQIALGHLFNEECIFDFNTL